jgi:hypothetical protein
MRFIFADDNSAEPSQPAQALSMDWALFLLDELLVLPGNLDFAAPSFYLFS